MSEDGSKSGRKSLKTLQRAASDQENLVGRPSKSLKHQLSQESPVEIEVKRKNISSKEAQGNLDTKIPSREIEVKKKNLCSKETQANLDTKISVEDLTNPHGASENYWKILAEKRQVALQEALDENERLRKVIEDLKDENSQMNQMLQEANSFIEVFKEELDKTTDDTGIDVNDVSTADETTEAE